MQRFGLFFVVSLVLLGGCSDNDALRDFKKTLRRHSIVSITFDQIPAVADDFVPVRSLEFTLLRRYFLQLEAELLQDNIQFEGYSEIIYFHLDFENNRSFDVQIINHTYLILNNQVYRILEDLENETGLQRWLRFERIRIEQSEHLKKEASR